MSFLVLLLIAIGLSMDCFAVSVGFSVLRTLKWKDILKTAFFFGLFQAIMPVIGWIVGNSIRSMIESVDHWIAFAILGIIGIRMIINSFKTGEKKDPIDIRNWHVLLALSLATSIEALITGVSFGFIKVNIFKAVCIIGIVTFLNTIIGMKVGEHSNFIPVKRAEMIGGLVLIAIGVKIVLQHTGVI